MKSINQDSVYLLCTEELQKINQTSEKYKANKLIGANKGLFQPMFVFGCLKQNEQFGYFK